MHSAGSTMPAVDTTKTKSHREAPTLMAVDPPHSVIIHLKTLPRRLLEIRLTKLLLSLVRRPWKHNTGSIVTILEDKLCGHGTIAAAHFLFTNDIVKCDVIEFVTKSGILTAKKIIELKQLQGVSSIELNFPVVEVGDCDPAEIPSIPSTLNGLSMINVKKTSTSGDIIVELSSGDDVANIQPNFDEIQKCAGRGLIITAPAPPGSGFDMFTRFFCPKWGVNEDPVCGSAHCALAPYWSKKLGKHNLVAYMASPRGGRLDLHLEEEKQRVRIKGEAVTVMAGTLLV